VQHVKVSIVFLSHYDKSINYRTLRAFFQLQCSNLRLLAIRRRFLSIKLYPLRK
jgi:hypothetical protein